MFEELVKRLRNLSGTDNIAEFTEAADAIEELSKPRWIPVTERLPDGIAIAVNALQGSYGYREYLIGYIGANEESDSGYSCESDAVILMNVTHWMQLPEPPKEE